MILTSDKWKESIEFVKFIVTGYEYQSKRKFKKEYGGTQADYYTAIGINLWIGSVWGITEEGKRKLIKKIYN